MVQSDDQQEQEQEQAMQVNPIEQPVNLCLEGALTLARCMTQAQFNLLQEDLQRVIDRHYRIVFQSAKGYIL